MNIHFFNELKLERGSEERLRMLAQELTRILANKKNKRFITKIKTKKIQVQPKGWT